MPLRRSEPRRHRHSGDDDGGHGPHDHEHPDRAVSFDAHVHPPLDSIDLLEPGAAEGHILYFDAHSGVAGDMFSAALLDLGVPFEVVERSVAALDLPGAGISITRTFAGAIAASRFHVHVGDATHERSYADIRELLSLSQLDAAVLDRAAKVFLRLATAEATVHGIPVEHVHFHEVGAVDAIIDVVAASACLAYLGGRVVCSPLPLGHGHTHCRHGVIPIPAPATVLCLEGMETFDGGLEVELTTPTGAAIVGALAEECRRWPEMVPLRTGWGAGQRQLPDRPNALRVVLGRPSSPSTTTSATHEVIECNVDDTTGEEVGHVIERLIAERALDAWASPIVMKKGRAAWTLHALCHRRDATHIVATLLRESTTIGLRRTLVSRAELERRQIEVNTEYGTVPVKVSGSKAEGTLHVKPEFDACVARSKEHAVPLRDVMNAALAAAWQAEAGSAP